MIGVTNIISSITIICIFIFLEFTIAFKFVNFYSKGLFFWDDYTGLFVILGDFSLGLSTAIVVRNAKILVVKVRVNQVYS